MKKVLKIVLIIAGILIGIILLDSLQALVFNNNPIIGTETKCKVRRGILVETYHLGNGENKTSFKFSDSTPKCLESSDLEEETDNND